MWFRCEKKIKYNYAIKTLKECFSILVIRGVYFAYFHSFLQYGIIWGGGGGNSHLVIQYYLFEPEESCESCVANCLSQLCTGLFKEFNIFPFPYIFIYKRNVFVKKNYSFHSYNIRNRCIQARSRGESVFIIYLSWNWNLLWKCFNIYLC